jgi:hypothetical protein
VKKCCLYFRGREVCAVRAKWAPQARERGRQEQGEGRTFEARGGARRRQWQEEKTNKAPPNADWEAGRHRWHARRWVKKRLLCFLTKKRQEEGLPFLLHNQDAESKSAVILSTIQA